VRREGAFGVLPSETATTLAMVVTELVQNAVEHGFGGHGAGTVVVDADSDGAALRVAVTDDGAGLPDGFDAEATGSLGLSIVRTLVTSELKGVLHIGPGPQGRGTRVAFDLVRDGASGGG
jgi:two-component system, sensor histidine kinase PdtaS